MRKIFLKRDSQAFLSSFGKIRISIKNYLKSSSSNSLCGKVVSSPKILTFYLIAKFSRRLLNSSAIMWETICLDLFFVNPPLILAFLRVLFNEVMVPLLIWYLLGFGCCWDKDLNWDNFLCRLTASWDRISNTFDWELKTDWALPCLTPNSGKKSSLFKSTLDDSLRLSFGVCASSLLKDNCELFRLDS